MNTKERLLKNAKLRGWTLTEDRGYVVAFSRRIAYRGGGMARPTADDEVLSLFFSNDDAGTGRRLIEVYNRFPTGDRYLTSGEPVYMTRRLTARDPNKAVVAGFWLNADHYAAPGLNETLRKMGFDPILPEEPND